MGLVSINATCAPFYLPGDCLQCCRWRPGLEKELEPLGVQLKEGLHQAAHMQH